MDKVVRSRQTQHTEQQITRRLLWSVPILFGVGGLAHFVYDWLGRIPITGLIFAVNESVWEHLKLAFYPLLVWWLITYFIMENQRIKQKSSLLLPLDFKRWFVAMTVSIVTSLLFILAFFYTYTGAFGFESTVLDILSLLVALFLGQLMAWHVYRYSGEPSILFLGSVVVIVLLILAFSLFTFSPPDLPLFRSSV